MSDVYMTCVVLFNLSCFFLFFLEETLEIKCLLDIYIYIIIFFL